MSLLQIAANMQAMAKTLSATQPLLEQAGRLIAEDIRSNIDKGQVAGEYRPEMDDSGAPPGGAMTPISRYTEEHRSQGNSEPLKDTGRLYREIGIRNSSATKVVVGGTTRYAQMILKKQMGSDISGIGSTDLDRLIPYRSPVGYSRSVLAAVLSLLDNAFGVNHNLSVVVKYEVRL